MSGWLQGIRGRVTLTVLVVAALLYSALATAGFLQIVASGRQGVAERVDDAIDRLHGELLAGRVVTRITTADGVIVELKVGDVVADEQPGTVVRSRVIDYAGTPATIIGTASLRSLNDGLRSLHTSLWIAVPLAVLFSAAVAGLATARALRPVDDITGLAARIGADAAERVPVAGTEDEIQRLATTVNDMLDRIAHGRRMLQRFTSDAAHELRTPLMALQGEIELARTGPLDADTLGRIARITNRLAGLVDELLLLSTLDEGRPIHRSTTDLLELARAEAEAAAPAATVEGAAVVMDVDEMLLGRAIRNLAANARRHSKSAVHVTVEGREPGVSIHVDDDGSGFDPEALDRVFERFGRADRSRSVDSGGAGLGLAIVSAIAEAHGGSVSAGAGPLGGARVSINLPA